MVESGLNIRSESRYLYFMEFNDVKEQDLKTNTEENKQDKAIMIKLEILTKLFLMLIISLSMSAIVLIFELFIKFAQA